MKYLSKTLKQIECNIDDMNPEFFPEVMDHLFESGAKDVWISPIIMKRGRPAQCLSVLCEENDIDVLCELIFSETSTLGIRVASVQRYELTRQFVEVETNYGTIPIKTAQAPNGAILNALPEHQACAKAAKEYDVPTPVVYQAAISAYENQKA